MIPKTHETLVTSASQGDGEAVASLLEQHLSGLLAYVRLHAGEHILHQESSADLVQSVCREVLEGLDGFEYRGEAAFRKWLFTAALNKIRERGRRLGAAKRGSGRRTISPPDLAALLPSFTTPSRVAIAEEDMARLERAFAELPEDHRRVITAAKILGQPHAEIAQELGRSEGAVRVLLHRALFRLGALMGSGE